MPIITTNTGQSSALVGIGQFGQMTFGTAGSLVGTGTIDESMIPTNFMVKRALEGPQIMISWTVPVNLVRFRYQLRRGSTEFPKTIDDGILIQDTTAIGDTVISDRQNLIHNKVYYYTLFMLEPESVAPVELWASHSTLQGSTVAFQTGFWEDKLFALVPEIYRVMDSRPDKGGEFGQQVLAAVTASSGTRLEGQNFNFSEDPGERLGQLQRFLKIFGLPLDEISNRLERVLTDFDLEESEGSLLPSLGSTIGKNVNEELPVDRQRAEVRTAYSTFKAKGTDYSVKESIRAATGSPGVTCHELRDSVLLTNRLDRTTAASRNGFPAADNLIAPNTLPTTPSGLLFDSGQADRSAGVIVSPHFDTENIRANFLYRTTQSVGAFTVECGLRIGKAPIPPSSVQLAPIADSQTKTFLLNQRIESNTDQVWALVLTTTRMGFTGTEVHELQVEYGGSGAPVSFGTTVLRASDAQGHFELGKNHHIAFTRKIVGSPANTVASAVWTLYIDGQEIHSATQDFTFPGVPTTNETFDGIVASMALAGELEQSRYTIDEVRVWNRTRTQVEIDRDKALSLPGTSSGLILQWKLNKSDYDFEAMGPGNAVPETALDNVASYARVDGLGQYPEFVAPVIEDQLVTQNSADTIRRRSRRFGSREDFVIGEDYHLRQVIISPQIGPSVRYREEETFV